MISRKEIKKCGFKPLKEHKSEYKTYIKKIPDGIAVLEHKNEETGYVVLSVASTEESTTQFKYPVFIGKIPARYELQIILRTTEIA